MRRKYVVCKTKQDARKTRRCEHDDGSVLVVRDQGARSGNAVFRSGIFVLIFEVAERSRIGHYVTDVGNTR